MSNPEQFSYQPPSKDIDSRVTTGRQEIRGPLENVNFHDVMQQIANDCKSEGRKFNPIVQDGGYEIHPDLKGIQFNFWISPKGGNVAVNFSGRAEKAPWAHFLTGKVFNDFSEAKSWLREEANRLSKAEKSKQQRDNDSRELDEARSKLK